MTIDNTRFLTLLLFPRIILSPPSLSGSIHPIAPSDSQTRSALHLAHSKSMDAS